jgi:hypothetical protein
MRSRVTWASSNPAKDVSTEAKEYLSRAIANEPLLTTELYVMQLQWAFRVCKLARLL